MSVQHGDAQRDSLSIWACFGALRLVGPERSPFRRAVIAGLVFGLLAWFLGWRAYGWYHLLAGNRSLQANHSRVALAHFERALQIWPNDGSAQLLAARAARRAGEFEVTEHYLTACQSAPSQADPAALERVLLRASKGEIDAVGGYCQALLEQTPADAPLVLEALAVGNLALLRFAAAEQALDRWLELVPDQPQATYLKGRLHLQANNNQEAMTYLSRAVELDPERDDVRLMLAGLQLDLGQAQEALPHLEFVCRRQETNLAAKARLAQALVLLGRSEEAVRVLDDVLRRSPHLGIALLERGKLALRDGDLDRAEQWLRQACERNVGDRAAHYQLLQCLKQRGKTKEIRAIQDRLDQIDQAAARMREIVTVELPERRFDAELQAELGDLLLNVGAYNEGTAWLNRALQFDPQQPRAHRALADYYRSLGQTRLERQHRGLAGSIEPPSKPPE